MNKIWFVFLILLIAFPVVQADYVLSTEDGPGLLMLDENLTATWTQGLDVNLTVVNYTVNTLYTNYTTDEEPTIHFIAWVYILLGIGLLVRAIFFIKSNTNR